MTHINTRRDTAANWTLSNPILQDGERGYEKDTRKSKTGDGVTHWNDLGYEVSAVSATKADVGLGAVDNTSDMDKPVSTAQASAIAAMVDPTELAAALAPKAPLASPAFTGVPTAPTSVAGTFDNTLATTLFVLNTLSQSSQSAQSGDLKVVARRTAPGGWLKCDGSAVSRSTYSALFAAIVPSMGTVTITVASPGVVTKTAHGLSTGDSVFLTTTGALPTGLAANTLYYVIRVNANTFQLATTRANAYAGTAINTSVSQSGTHTLWDCPYGLGNGSTTFNLPDARGRALAGMDVDAGTAAGRLSLAQAQGAYGNLGSSGGEQGHQLTTAELASHQHGLSQLRYSTNYTTAASSVGLNAAGSALTQMTDTTGSDIAHNNVQPTLLGNVVIKF